MNFSAIMNKKISERSVYGNIVPAGSEICLSNMANVFWQASLQGLDVTSDCVIIVSMVRGPPTLQVQSTSDFSARLGQNGKEATAEIMLSRGQRPESLVCCFVTSSKGGSAKNVTTFQELSPDYLNRYARWKEAQDECARDYADVIDECQNNQLRQEATLKELVHTVLLGI